MRIGPLRPVNPDAISAPQGYRVEALFTGLSFPSAISFGPGGEIYLAECGGCPVGGAGQIVAAPRVLRVDPDFSITEIGRLENPIVGLVYRQGELLIAEDGPSPRILRVTAEGEVKILVEGLPGGGDYGLSGLSLDNSGALIFGIGTRTNSGVVGLDNIARGWVGFHLDWADVPGSDVELEGANYVTGATPTGNIPRAITGGYRPFSRRSNPGDVVRGNQRCGGAVYRIPLDTGELERIAWGFRNPIGVGAAPDGRLFATEGGMEERGSRPIAGAPDCLWEVRTGSHYGWPDHAAGVSVEDARYRLPGHPRPRKLLSNAPQVAGAPAATFAPRSGIGRFDFSISSNFGHAGEAFVALSGEWTAAAYISEDSPSAGYRVVRVDPKNGQATDFLVNRNGTPSSSGNSGGLERPFDVCFDPSGEVLYVVDTGEIVLNREFGLEPFGGTGVVWRVTRIGATISVPARGTVETVESDEGADEEVEGPEGTDSITAEVEEDAEPEFGSPGEETEEVTSEEQAPIESIPLEDFVIPTDEGEPESFETESSGESETDEMSAPAEEDPTDEAPAEEAPADDAAPGEEQPAIEDER